jgi:adenylate kinase family enzyme
MPRYAGNCQVTTHLPPPTPPGGPRHVAGTDALGARRYLDDPPTAAELTDVLVRVNLEPWDLVRHNEPEAECRRISLARESSVQDAVWMQLCQSCDKLTAMEPNDGRAVCPRCGSTGDAVVLRPLFVVTGASCAGKSTIVAPLARRLQGRCVTFDVDVLLDAEGPLSESRWLAIAHCVAQSGLPTVLLGPIIPECLDRLAARCWVSDIHVIVLDCPDELRRARINARPPWRSRDIDEQVKFGRWLRSNISDRVDTSSGSPDETAAAIAAWIGRHLARTEYRRQIWLD